LGKKKERTLILTNEGRAFLVSENHDDVPELGDSGKIKATIPLDKFSVITLEDDPKGRTWSVESVLPTIWVLWRDADCRAIRARQSIRWRIRRGRPHSGLKRFSG